MGFAGHVLTRWLYQGGADAGVLCVGGWLGDSVRCFYLLISGLKGMSITS